MRDPDKFQTPSPTKRGPGRRPLLVGYSRRGIIKRAMRMIDATLPDHLRFARGYMNRGEAEAFALAPATGETDHDAEELGKRMGILRKIRERRHAR